MDEISILNNQLNRIRQMNKFYHQQFLLDVRILFILNTSFLYIGFNNRLAYVIIPIISLFGAVLLSFHAHFLIFSRNYSEFIEQNINKISKKDLLIGHKLENSYFFPTKDKKLVVASFGKKFTWFSFVTIFIAFFGISSYIFSIYQLFITTNYTNYLFFITFITFITLLIGIWWFLLGNGEKRLEKIFSEYR